MTKRALLLSGGMDSVALAWWKRPYIGITIDYGQAAAEGEIRAAGAVARCLGIRHEIIRVDCSSLGSGDMAGSTPISVAPVTEWWPYRNQMLATLAAMKAVGLGIGEIMLGSVATDSSHVDGTEAFYHALNAVVEMQEGAIRVSVPAIHLSSVELIKSSGIPRSVLSWAHSCHKSDLACGCCRGCHKHALTMSALGYGDY